MVEPLLLTVPEACRILGCSRSRLYEKLQSGELRALKDGRRTLLAMASLRTYIDGLPSAYSPAANKGD